MMVASSGNWRLDLQFPSNDGRPIAVGGIDSSGALWDESPPPFIYSYCPPPTSPRFE